MHDLTPYFRKFESVQVKSLLKKEGLHLALQFYVNDPDKLVNWKSIGEFQKRSNDLWQNSCFEFFINKPSEKNYFEVNLSAGGSWNSYEFSDYREAMKESAQIELVDFTQNQKKSWFEVMARFKTEPHLLAQPLNLSLTAVIKGLNGEIDYYSNLHLGPKPDFHKAESRCIVL